MRNRALVVLVFMLFMGVSFLVSHGSGNTNRVGSPQASGPLGSWSPSHKGVMALVKQVGRQVRLGKVKGPDAYKVARLIGSADGAISDAAFADLATQYRANHDLNSVTTTLKAAANSISPEASQSECASLADTTYATLVFLVGESPDDAQAAADAVYCACMGGVLVDDNGLCF